jgi:hypothetical protein
MDTIADLGTESDGVASSMDHDEEGREGDRPPEEGSMSGRDEDGSVHLDEASSSGKETSTSGEVVSVLDEDGCVSDEGVNDGADQAVGPGAGKLNRGTVRPVMHLCCCAGVVEIVESPAGRVLEYAQRPFDMLPVDPFFDHLACPVGNNAFQVPDGECLFRVRHWPKLMSATEWAADPFMGKEFPVIFDEFFMEGASLP